MSGKTNSANPLSGQWTCSLGDGGWIPAGIRTICGKSHPDLEACWSADNGCDGFGEIEADPEMDRVRSRYGEVLDAWPCCPRLILFRPTKTAPLWVSVWHTYSLEYSRVIRDLGGLAAACARMPPVVPAARKGDPAFHIELIDWDANREGAKGLVDSDSRYELSISVNGWYSHMPQIKTMYREFMKDFTR